MKGRERFKNAIRGQSVDRPPVWLMRQAGRYLPEYQKIKSKYDFLTRVRTAEIAAEISLQPWRRFKMDGVILFSDILIPPLLLNQEVTFTLKGPKLTPPITTVDQLKNLPSTFDKKPTAFVTDTLRLIRSKIKNEAALIGFCGAPWTVACYMGEGGKAKSDQFLLNSLIKSDPDFAKALLQRVTNATLTYLDQQISGDADVIQIFDSWGGTLNPAEYKLFSLPYIKQLIDHIDNRVPVTLFCKNGAHLLSDLVNSGCQTLGVDWSVDLSTLASQIPDRLSIQGNLNPEILLGTKENIMAETTKMLKSARQLKGYIANLGHGVIKETPPENVGVFVDSVKAWSS